MIKKYFNNPFSESIFRNKYAQGPNDTWGCLAIRVVEDVCGGNMPLMSKEDRKQLTQYIEDFKFIPAGRYLWYAGRKNHYYNNCYLLKAEYDTREEWADLTQRAVSCLMTGGGIGIDYSILRPSGKPLSRTGGLSSGPIPLMQMINEVGRGVMQGGSRRSAIYASLNWQHEDIYDFLKAKNWTPQIRSLKEEDFNFPAPLDMTNISVNYDDAALVGISRTIKTYKIAGSNPEYNKINDKVFFDSVNILAENPIFLENCKQALKTGEPGFSFNFGDKQNETLRNACCEVTSEDDSDVCNLGSINLGNIESLEEFRNIVCLASKFLVCGTLRADLPYDKVYKVREKNRRLGLGLMGIHAWLLKREQKYEVTPELHTWLKVYKDESERAANEHCNHLYISKPVAYRAIAPTGTIGILASYFILSLH